MVARCRDWLAAWAMLVLICSAAVAAGILACGAATPRQSISPGVRIGGIDVGGLSLSRAQALLEEKTLPDLTRGEVIVRCGDRNLIIPYRNVDLAVDCRQALQAALVEGGKGGIAQRSLHSFTSRLRGRSYPLPVTFNEDKLKKEIERLAAQIDRAPVEARLSLVDDRLVLTPEQEGCRLDREDLRQKVAGRLTSLSAEPVEAGIQPWKPALTARELAAVKDELAVYATTFNPADRNRTQNLMLAAREIDGIILKPGEEFSFNQTVGERLTEKGYREAPVFVSGRVATDIGGGVCQVSSTLYNAVLLAGLTVTERKNHSRPVGYVPPGLDATVSYGSIDLKFKNTTGKPILITGRIQENRLLIRIFGRNEKPGRTVTLMTTGAQTLEPPVVTLPDPNLPRGVTKIVEPGYRGMQVTVYRLFKEGEKIIKKELISTDTYAPGTRIIRVGAADGIGTGK
ncbi:MAG: VanW family protein [Armatimonadetes bacterium]|nr:VanW family protein [Armatimonadota bacterium]